MTAAPQRTGLIHAEGRWGHRLDTKPVTADIVEQMLSRAIDDLEPTLTRNGYDAATITIQLNPRSSDVGAYLASTFDSEHVRELTDKMRQVGAR